MTKRMYAAALACAAAWLTAPAAFAQDAATSPDTASVQDAASVPSLPADRFDAATSTVQRDLAESLAELDRLRDAMAAERIPLGRRLSELEAQLSSVRQEYQQVSRSLDTSTLDLSNLKSEIKSRQDEASYLSNLLGEYGRNFESRLHIAELQRYEAVLEKAKLAQENEGLSQQDLFAVQAELVSTSLDRLLDALGGTRFDGTAVDPSGLVDHGTFVLVGPAALFRSQDGSDVGTAEQRLGSLEPTIIPFSRPEDGASASRLIETGVGEFPLDPTLGDAHKIEATEETFVEHVKKGGPVMIPIFVMAGAALLVVLFKWLSMVALRKPRQQSIDALLDAVEAHDEQGARERAAAIKGPVGRMLAVGVEHIREPKDLIEEVMYEQVFTTRLKLDRLLPFVAICAASAPLLGLLGTVTGIINTFKLITVFGSGDVKSLSGGISEALITTEFGLIVAIPSLLLHAFLSRKARGVVSQMEGAAVALVNQIGKSPFRRDDGHGGHGPSDDGRDDGELLLEDDRESVRDQVREALTDLLAPKAARVRHEDELTRA
ncbi:MAG: MotA/TolQ/ExbB proton channel family protein [Planctomycetes bacterium]|nr:MotA/TolQ/ExbB proton channel family protein [Planctomycetota bacterium]